MGRFLPPAPFREEYGCVRNSSASSGLCVTLGRKLKKEEPIESQFCEDNIIEQSVGSHGLIVGVFDGHGGHQCSRVLPEQLVASVAQLMSPEAGLTSDSLVSAFRRVDADWCTGTQSDESGTTATLGVIQGQRLTIAHVGDTRALIVRKDGSCEVLTTSHRASNATERAHILSRGGDIPEHSHGECARVNGIIEVTRSLGDRWLKPVLDCTPEVVACELTEDDAFLIIGSDGLFDNVDDATVARIATKDAENGLSQCETAFTLAKMAYRNGSLDDISAYVLSLSCNNQAHVLDDAQVNIQTTPCSNAASSNSEPILAPQTPAQRNVAEGTAFRPLSNGSLDELPHTALQGANEEHEPRSWRHSIPWSAVKWGACAAVGVAGLAILARRRCRI